MGNLKLRLPFAATSLAASVALVALCSCAVLVATSPAETAPSARVQVDPGEQEAAQSDPEADNAVEAALASYISRRWFVAEDTARRVIRLAHEAAQAHKLDPLLVLSVVARESSFQHNGNAGTLVSDARVDDVDPRVAHGLMQVAGRHHPEKMPVDKNGRMRATTDAENLFIGAEILKEYLDRERGDLRRALQRYNGNLKDQQARFATYVLRVREKLGQVAEAANAAAPLN